MKPPRTFDGGFNFERLRYNYEQLAKAVSNISFGTTTNNTDPDMNTTTWKATGTTPSTPNTAFTVNHYLSHVPFGFAILRTNAACHIYDSGTAWTAATKTAYGTISLKCDTATVAFTIMIC
jgi:hypothetical protein